jgi:2-polyprenyl-6-methoxyphenol hydroxylase-like FAD-dependent oxidoreductase
LGAGIAGLCAARVLADHVDEVILIERDELPQAPAGRAGIPQGRHLHNLLVRGHRELETLFPGFGAAIEAGGAPRVDLTKEMAFLSIWGWAPRYASDLISRLATRDLFEHVIRERVRHWPRVTVLQRHEVQGLLVCDDRVRGVRCTPRGAATRAVDEIAAALVLDACGRRSRVIEWLAAMGLPPPPETVVDAQLGYSTRLFKRPAVSFDWQGVVVRNPMPSARLAGVLPAEGGRWIVTLAGFGPDRPPTDTEGYMAFIESLADPSVADALRRAQPLSGVFGYRDTANRWRHFERLPHWPEGLALIGDGICSFNPLYGQGMTVSVLEVLALRDLLIERGVTADLGDRLRREVPRVLGVPWGMATSEDYRYLGTQGPRRGVATRIRHWAGDQIARAGMQDAAVHYQWMRVVNLVDPPTTLLRPSLLWRAAAARMVRSDGARPQ